MIMEIVHQKQHITCARINSVSSQKTAMAVFTVISVRIVNVVYIVCFLVGDSPASEFYMQTFRNALYVPYIVICKLGPGPPPH
jgi:hypothetical protein